MFVNFSNHPSSKWSDIQREAAYRLCSDNKILDIPFPNIDRRWNRTRLMQEALDFIKLLGLLRDAEGLIEALHIMGESSYVFVVLYMIEFANYGAGSPYPTLTCYYSTTQHIVVEKEDGTKESKFEFVQFRGY